MPAASRTLIKTASKVKNERIRARILSSSSTIRALENRKEAEGGMIDRAFTLSDMKPFFGIWEQAYKKYPKAVPEPPGFWSKLLFSTAGIPTGSIGKIMLTLVSNISKAKPGILRVLTKTAMDEGMKDQAAAIQQAEAKFDSLVSPLREYANYSGVPPKIKSILLQAVGQAG